VQNFYFSGKRPEKKERANGGERRTIWAPGVRMLPPKPIQSRQEQSNAGKNCRADLKKKETGTKWGKLSENNTRNAKIILKAK
jgi:hypothetical protein